MLNNYRFVASVVLLNHDTGVPGSSDDDLLHGRRNFHGRAGLDNDLVLGSSHVDVVLLDEEPGLSSVNLNSGRVHPDPLVGGASHIELWLGRGDDGAEGVHVDSGLGLSDMDFGSGDVNLGDVQLVDDHLGDGWADLEGVSHELNFT